MKTAVWKTWDLPAAGVDLDEWQNFRCAWCGYDKERLVKDHCHMTGLVRGLLCRGCNTREASSWLPEWEEWRNGDNPAWAIKQFEIYVNHMGATPISSQSSLHWFSPEERAAWFELSVQFLADGRMTEWPKDVPWVDTALQRKEDAYAEMRRATSKWTFLAPPQPDAEQAS